MAVNTQKFLPSSKGGALAKVNKKIINSSTSISLSEKSVKDIGIIRVKVIEIDSILKGTLAAEKKKLNEAKKQESSKRREKIEEKLETKPKPKAESGKIKMPSFPRMGFLDWVKNFIGNVILGYFAVRLVDHLPKIIPIVKFLGKATDFVLDVGGKLLDGLVTFIDWGYKAVDFSRGLIGKTFGDEALKNFDKLTSEFEKFMNLAIIVGMASADFGMDRLGRKLTGKGAERAAEKGAGTLARRGVGRVSTRAAARVGGKGAAKLTAKIGSKVLKAVPFLGAGLAIAEGIMRIKDGDYVGGLLSFGSAIPVAGWAFLALDVAREFMGGQEFDKSVGRAFSGKTGLTDKQVRQRTPHLSGPSFMGVAGGGITRGGKTQGGVRRTIKKQKYKRKIARTPEKTQFKSDIKSPLRKTGEELDKTKYFGPILALTTKLQLKEEPTVKDYQNVGIGLNLLISKGIDDGQLKGGLVPAFAEGGMVDGDFLSAVEKGVDISSWISTIFKKEFETNAQKTLRMIREMRMKEDKQKEEKEKEEEYKNLEVGPGGVVTGGNADFWALVAIASLESGTPQGRADVAQSIYNRLASGIYGGKSIKELIVSGNGRQYQPVERAVKEFRAISDKESAINAIMVANKLNKQQAEKFINDTASAIQNPELQKSAAQFVGGRTDFWAEGLTPPSNGVGYVVRHGHRFGWFVGPAAIAYGKKNPGPAKAPALGDIKVMGGGADGEISLGKGYGSAGSKIAGELGRYIKSKLRQGPDFSLVHRHPEHPPYSLTSGHSRGSLHYQGRAVDIGAYTHEQGPILNVIAEFNKMKGVKPVQLLHGKNEPSGHSDHVHVAYAKGGRVRKPTLASIGEKGPEFIFDADTTAGLDRLAPQLLERLNMAKTKPQLASILQSYTGYEQPYAEPEYIEVPVPMPMMMSEESDYESSGDAGMFGGDEESDPFGSLYQGG